MGGYRRYTTGSKFLTERGPVEIIEGPGVTVKFLISGEILTFDRKGFNKNIIASSGVHNVDYRSEFSDWVDANKAVEFMSKQLRDYKRAKFPTHMIEDSELQLKKRTLKLRIEELKFTHKG